MRKQNIVITAGFGLAASAALASPVLKAAATPEGVPYVCAEAQVNAERGVTTPIQIGSILLEKLDITGNEVLLGDRIAEIGTPYDGDTYAGITTSDGNVSVIKGECPTGVPQVS